MSSSPVQRSTWYRARKPLPAITVIVLLGVAAGLVWLGVLNKPDSIGSGCQGTGHTAADGPAPVTSGQRLPPDGLDAVPPAPPQSVVVQVLNANGARGEAGGVAAELTDLGFTPTAEPANDPLHPAFDLHCHGEIRFGPAGQAAARTLSLAVPCVDLVRDARADEVIDLALGTKFTKLQPNAAAREALRGLSQRGPAASGAPRGRKAERLLAPAIDPALLRQARAVDC